MTVFMSNPSPNASQEESSLSSEYQRLKSKYEDQQHHLDLLINRVNELEEKNRDLEQTLLIKSRSENKNSDTRINDLELTNQKLLNENSSLSDRLERLEKEISLVKAPLSEQKTTEKSKSEIDILDAPLERYQQEKMIEQQFAEVNSMFDQMKKQKDEISMEADERSKAHQNEIQLLKDRISELMKEKHYQPIKEEETDIDQDFDRAEDMVYQKEIEVDRLKKLVDKLSSTQNSEICGSLLLNPDDPDIDSLLRSNEELHQSIQEKDQIIIDLQNKLESADAESENYQELFVENNKLKKKLKENQLQMNSYEKNISETMEKLNELQMINTTLEYEFESLKSQKNESKKDKSDDNEDEQYNLLTSLLDRKNKELSENEKKLNTLEKENHQLKLEVQSLNKVEHQNTSIVSAEKIEFDSLENLISNLQVENKKISNENEELKKNNSTLKEELKNISEERKNNINEVEGLKKSKEEFQDQVNSLKEKVIREKEEKEKALKRIQQMEIEHVKKISVDDKIEAELLDKRKKLKVAEKTIKLLEQLNSEQMMKIQKYSDQIEKFQNHWNEIAQKNIKLVEEIKLVRGQFYDKDKELKETKQENKTKESLISEIHDLRMQNEELSDKVALLENQLSRLFDPSRF